MTFCLGLLESNAGDRDDVVADGNRVEDEVAVGIRVRGRGPVGGLRLDHHHGALHGTMLRIVNDAADRADNARRRRDGCSTRDVRKNCVEANA